MATVCARSPRGFLDHGEEAKGDDESEEIQERETRRPGEQEEGDEEGEAG